MSSKLKSKTAASSAKPAASASSSSSKSSSGSIRASTWECLNCTLQNQASATQCEACDEKKPASYTLRFRLPSELFSLDLAPSTSLAELKIMIESRTGMHTKHQRFYFVDPDDKKGLRQEMYGLDTQTVLKLLPLKDGGETLSITVESRAASSSSSGNGGGGALSPSSASGGDDWGGFDEETRPSKGAADEAEDPDAFIAWLETGDGGSVSMPPGALQRTASAEAATRAKAEIDPFADDAGCDGDDGWGDDDGGDDFVDDEDGDNLEVTKAQQAKSVVVDEGNQVLQSSNKNKRLGEYDCLTMPTLMSMQKATLQELQEELACSISEAAIMMRRFRWKREQLLTEYLQDDAKVQAKCGLTRMQRPPTLGKANSCAGAAATAAAASAVPASAPEKVIGECPLCGDDMTGSNSLDLGCTANGDHRFCNACWKNWAVAQMDKGPQAIFTTCCAFKCPEIVPDDIFLLLLPRKQQQLLSKWLIRNYVDSLPTLKWCPNPRCTRVIRFETGGARDVECDCGTRFCFACMHPESHSPCQCEIVKKWNEKSSSDSENNTWLLANTKSCPGCKAAIEKNSGCNHMTCKGCKHEFCWLCKGEWSKHGANSGGYYACNVYEAVKSKAGSNVSSEEQTAADAKAKLERYQFYFERTLEYDKSIAAAVRSLPETERRMELLQNFTSGTLADVEFLANANKTVIECRRALKWSYVIAFYLKDGSRQKQMFEIDQGQLEKFSDELHGLIEVPLEKLIPERVGVTAGSIGASSSSTLLSNSKVAPKAAPKGVTASPSPAHKTAPTAASPSSGSAASSSATPQVIQGDDLKRLIIKKTATANKYLTGLVEAADQGQYVDLQLQRLPST